MKMSLVVPCYNEEEAIPIFYREALKVIEQLKDEFEFEFCFVDDGSKDGTLQCFKDLRAKDERVHYVSFSRNFGKESALYAGLQLSTGDYVATLDVDLRDPPSLLPEMWKTIKESEGKEDYDCVATRRVNRAGEPPIRSFFARMFYKIINKMSSTEIVDGARDFRLMKRKMVDAILKGEKPEISDYEQYDNGTKIVGTVTSDIQLIDADNYQMLVDDGYYEENEIMPEATATPTPTVTPEATVTEEPDIDENTTEAASASSEKEETEISGTPTPEETVTPTPSEKPEKDATA